MLKFLHLACGYIVLWCSVYFLVSFSSWVLVKRCMVKWGLQTKTNRSLTLIHSNLSGHFQDKAKCLHCSTLAVTTSNLSYKLRWINQCLICSHWLKTWLMRLFCQFDHGVESCCCFNVDLWRVQLYVMSSESHISTSASQCYKSCSVVFQASIAFF